MDGNCLFLTYNVKVQIFFDNEFLSKDSPQVEKVARNDINALNFPNLHDITNKNQTLWPGIPKF